MASPEESRPPPPPDGATNIQYRVESSTVKSQRESLSLWRLRREPDYDPDDFKAYLSHMPEAPQYSRPPPSKETVPLHLFKPKVDSPRSAPARPASARPGSAQSPRSTYTRPSSARSAVPPSEVASTTPRREPPTRTWFKARRNPYHDPPVTQQRKTGLHATEIAAHLENVDMRDAYPEPPSVDTWWPPEKTPSLGQMERDMLLWARAGHEVKTRSFHEGRVAEYKRAREIFLGILAHDERVASLNVGLRKELTRRRIEQESQDSTVQELAAALEGQTMRFEASKRSIAALSGENERVEAELHSLKSRFDGEIKAAKEKFEDESESLKLQAESLKARVELLESQLAESSALNALATERLAASDANGERASKAAASFRAPVPIEIEPVIAEAVTVAMLPLKEATSAAVRGGTMPPPTRKEDERAWWDAGAYSTAEPKVAAAIGAGLVSRAREACAAKYGDQRWSAQYGYTFVKHLYKKGGKAALAALLMDSGLVRETVDEIVETLEKRMPAAAIVHEAAARAQDGGEADAVHALETELMDAVAEGVPSALLVPYQAVLASAKSRAGQAPTLASRKKQINEDAAARTIQSRKRAQEQKREAVKQYDEQKVAIVKIQSSARGRTARQEVGGRRAKATTKGFIQGA